MLVQEMAGAVGEHVGRFSKVFCHYGLCNSSKSSGTFNSGIDESATFLLQAPLLVLAIIGAISAIFLWRSKTLTPKPLTASSQICTIDTASLPSRLFFSWANPLLKTGYNTRITDDDLWDLSEGDSAHGAYQAFQEQWQRTPSKTPRSIWISLLRAFGPHYLLAGVFKAVADVSNIAQPLLFRTLIASVMDRQRDTAPSKERSFAIALVIFILLLLQTFCKNQDEFIIMQTGIRIESALRMVIYEKITRLSNKARSSNPSGTIANHFAVEVLRVKNLAEHGHKLWAIPFQVALALYSLHQLLGAVSTSIAFVTLVAVIPLLTSASKYVHPSIPYIPYSLTQLGHFRLRTLTNESIEMHE
jgi:hypothetical protein